jgi:hypothetical protein
VKVAVPVTVEPLFDSSVAFAVAADAGGAADAAGTVAEDPAAGAAPEPDEDVEEHPRTSAAAAPRTTEEMVRNLILSSFFCVGRQYILRSQSGASMKNVPPLETSRLLLLALVAAGAILAIAASGRLADFGGGFAVGAGAVLILSKAARRPSEESLPGEEKGEPS